MSVLQSLAALERPRNLKQLAINIEIILSTLVFDDGGRKCAAL